MTRLQIRVYLAFAAAMLVLGAWAVCAPQQPVNHFCHDVTICNWTGPCPCHDKPLRRRTAPHPATARHRKPPKVVAHSSETAVTVTKPFEAPPAPSGSTLIAGGGFVTPSVTVGNVLSIRGPGIITLGPIVVGDYNDYTIRAKDGWICAFSSNYIPSMNPLRYDPPTQVALTCVHAVEPKN